MFQGLGEVSLQILQSALLYRVIFFSLVPPNFNTKKKIANQPITAAVPVNPVTMKGRDWLLGVFLFGTEIGGYQ